MKAFFSKYKILIISVCTAVVVLTAAFLAGGSLKNSKLTSDSSSPDTAFTVSSNVVETESVIQSTEKSENKTSKIQEKKASSSEKETKATTKPAAVSDSKIVQPLTTIPQATTKKPPVKPQSDKNNNQNTPAQKPKPVEPQEQEIKDKSMYCTVSISCSTILDNMDMLDPDKLELVPLDGWIKKPVKVKFKEGESVYDVLERVCKTDNIHLEVSWTPVYNSVYIEGINNLYELDCGENSGWVYSVNDWFPNYGCSRYQLKNGDTLKFLYTCDDGADVGANRIIEE